ncbi:hypothetical protein NDU88_004596, partial [Pleurodeles waltl]
MRAPTIAVQPAQPQPVRCSELGLCAAESLDPYPKAERTELGFCALKSYNVAGLSSLEHKGCNITHQRVCFHCLWTLLTLRLWISCCLFFYKVCLRSPPVYAVSRLLILYCVKLGDNDFIRRLWAPCCVR